MNPLTDIVGRHHAVRFEVCKQGGLVAFHFATSHGKVIVTASLGQFVEACRGPRDFNGNRFPEYAPPAPPKSRADIYAPGEFPPPRGETRQDLRRTHNRACGMPEDQREVYQAALDLWLSGGCKNRTEAFRRQGKYPEMINAWIGWIKKPPQIDYAANYRGPVRKPGGKLL